MSSSPFRWLQRSEVKKKQLQEATSGGASTSQSQSQYSGESLGKTKAKENVLNISAKKAGKLRKNLRYQRRFVLVGLDNAGKTTILNQLCLMDGCEVKKKEKKRLGKTSLFDTHTGLNIKANASGASSSVNNIDTDKPWPGRTVPTLEFDVRTLKYKKFKIHFTDVGGQDALRQFWRHHYTGAQGVIFVVDSSDSSRLMNAYKELELILLDDQLRQVPILVFANKQDLADSLSAEALEGRFAESMTAALRAPRMQIRFHEGSGLTNEGVFEGLDWLCEKSSPI